MYESFYLLGGSYTVTCGDDTFDVSAGDFVHLPRGSRTSTSQDPTTARS